MLSREEEEEEEQWDWMSECTSEMENEETPEKANSPLSNSDEPGERDGIGNHKTESGVKDHENELCQCTGCQELLEKTEAIILGDFSSFMLTLLFVLAASNTRFKGTFIGIKTVIAAVCAAALSNKTANSCSRKVGLLPAMTVRSIAWIVAARSRPSSLSLGLALLSAPHASSVFSVSSKSEISSTPEAAGAEHA